MDLNAKLKEIADPTCYGCCGMGRIQGFGMHGVQCPCTKCSQCDELAVPDLQDEGKNYCLECHKERCGE